MQNVFACFDLFERVVAENGALLYRPATRAEKRLADRPARFVEVLRAHQITPLSMGRVIVAAWTPHETAVIETIRDQGQRRLLPWLCANEQGFSLHAEVCCAAPESTLPLGPG